MQLSYAIGVSKPTSFYIRPAAKGKLLFS
ncbi:hypothetical protein [Wolbachia pipientis]|nr:hypothetical protein [Wolbachia pipientis]